MVAMKGLQTVDCWAAIKVGCSVAWWVDNSADSMGKKTAAMLAELMADSSVSRKVVS